MFEWILFIVSVALGARLMATLVTILVHVGSVLLVFVIIFAVANPPAFEHMRQVLGTKVGQWVHPEEYESSPL